MSMIQLRSRLLPKVLEAPATPTVPELSWKPVVPDRVTDEIVAAIPSGYIPPTTQS